MEHQSNMGSGTSECAIILFEERAQTWEPISNELKPDHPIIYYTYNYKSTLINEVIKTKEGAKVEQLNTT